MESLPTLATLLAKRKEKLSADTTAFRLSDGTPWKGVFIDCLSDRLLVSLKNATLPTGLRELLERSGLPTYIKLLDQNVKEAPRQLCGPEAPLRFPVLENGVRYMIDMAAGYSQGLFLDQRDNRAEVRRRCQKKPGALLNTFSYTGAFSVCAALSGATATTLDLAQPCLHWCRENMELNGIDPNAHFFCKGDTLHWLSRFARQGRKFDGIILDPPTFSRDARGNIWRVEKDYSRLVSMAAACLAPHGWILCTTNCRKVSHRQFRDMVAAGIPHAKISTSPMPFDFDGEDYLKTIWAEI